MANTLKTLTRDTDRTQAREIASEISKLVDSKVSSNQRLVIGEAFCPFKIPIHTKEFWCTLFVSDVSYVLSATHRRQTNSVLSSATFCVNIKVQSEHMFATKRMAEVSTAIGVPVYCQPWADAEEVMNCFLSDRVFQKLLKIDFAPLTELFISPIQLRAESSLLTSARCAEQARVLRDLVTSLFEECWRRRQKEDGQTR